MENNKKLSKILTAESLDFNGYGVTKELGHPCFIPDLLPGEKGLVDVVFKKSYYEGKLNKRLTTSPFRKDYSNYNKTSLIHLENSKQREFQVSITKDTLKKFKLDIELNEIVYNLDYYNYRNKLTYTCFNDKYLNIGYLNENSNTKQEFINDSLAPLKINELVKKINNYYQENKFINENIHKIIFRINKKNQVMIIFGVTKNYDLELKYYNFLLKDLDIKSIYALNYDKTKKIFLDYYKHIYGERYLEYRFDNKKYYVFCDSFLQVNTSMINKMYDLIKENLKNSKIVIDAFSGISSISIYVSDIVKKIYSIEINKKSVECAKYTINKNDIKNINLINDDFFKVDSKIFKSADTIILDPPRSGLNKEIITKINESGIEKVIYLSCKLPTLCRDLVDFIEYGYKVKAFYPIKNFYQTVEMESLVILEK